MDSCFILLQVAPLKSYFERRGERQLVAAIDKGQWEEIIYFDNAQPRPIRIDGLRYTPHTGIYNRVQSLALSQLLSDTQDLFAWQRYEAGFYLHKADCAAWLDFMLSLCKRFHEHEYDDILWDLCDLQVDERLQAVIEHKFAWTYAQAEEANSRHTRPLVQVAARLADFRQMKRLLEADAFDWLLFYLSY